MNQHSAIGSASLTLHGKRAVAQSMYLKGKAFIGAARMLRQRASTEHVEYVVLHLLCQGIEIVLKGLLLSVNYDKYKSLLRRNLGYNIYKTAEEASSAFQLNPMRHDLNEELSALSKLYEKHLLRYGTGISNSQFGMGKVFWLVRRNL